MFWMLKTQDLFVEAETATGAAVESKLVATENIQSGLPSKILKSSIDIVYHLQTSIQTHDCPLSCTNERPLLWSHCTQGPDF